MNARSRILDWFERLSEGGTMSKTDVCFLIVQIRHLIESSNKRNHYRISSFYSDWTVHSALDRSPVCFEIMRDITRVLAEEWATTSPELPSRVSGIIGLPTLRKELLALFSEHELPLAIFEHYVNWKHFGMFLLWHVEGQPLSWPADPGKAAKTIRAEMLAIPRPNNIAAESLTIVQHNGSYQWRLQLSGDKTITLLGGLDSIEGPDAFRRPPA